MADPAAPKQAPSPLFFSATTPSLPLGQSFSSTTSNVSQNAVSMPFIKRHVTRRLKTAKQECDKELTALTSAITSFFEDKLREGDGTREMFSDNTSVDDSDRESRRLVRDTPPHSAITRLQLTQTEPEGESSDGEDGYEADPESNKHSRQASQASTSPVSLRRQHTFPKDPNRPKYVPGETSPLKHSNTSETNIPPPLLPPQQTSTAAARRLSRSINMPPPVPTYSHSATSSRSTSRSRSPMPSAKGLAGETAGMRSSFVSNRRASRILVDDPIDPFMLVLHSITALCTDIIDMPLSAFTTSPEACAELVQKVQQIGQAWDEHPDWHGRAWYVQLLLTVAGLSRVVEWWDAEKQFWNFDDDDATGTPGEDDRPEPLTFVLKPPEGDSTRSSSVSPRPREDDKSINETEGRHSRDEQQKQLGEAEGEPITEGEKYTEKHDDEAQQLFTSSDDVERLQEKVVLAQSLNIVMELDLDGDHLIWVNDAWRTVVGTEPEQAIDSTLSSMLPPDESDVFRQASRQLQENDSCTIEVEFRLRVEVETLEPMFRSMEGKGMLMFDRISGRATHTMWVIKPLSDPEPQTPDAELDVGFDLPRQRSADIRIDTTEVLCRICECLIPQWFFEMHSDTCHQSHKLEADIGECNESIDELRNTIRDLLMHLDKGASALEYRGDPILSTVPSPVRSGPLQIFRPPLAGRLQRMNVKKLQKRLFEELDDILQVASEISIPSLKEEEHVEPVERQRLLSPGSERKIQTVRTWNRPSSDDPVLSKLVADVDTLMKAKLDSVVRMQNTVRYTEKVRQEWEIKVRSALASVEEEEGQMEGPSYQYLPGSAADDSGGENFAREESEGHISSTNPTPIAPSPVVAAVTALKEVSISEERIVPKSYSNRPLKSATTSSPLASISPILPPSPHRDLLPPPIFDGHYNSSKPTDPIVTVTPPLSPKPSLHRRSSSTAPLHSHPTLPSGHRLTSVPPSAKTQPSSIKDFEIIKPISKGAFGSVFLAKKRVTGDYYAIKVLKKSDMIAKNQITNVKAERMILMKQGESPFVVKLYWTFQSRDNLYLVMEYLNGGDCAALIKVIGSLPEEWTRNYVAEVVLGLEYLHQKGVTHRDLKPDNLLIDQQGHLKLTDFGLSKIGLLGRQARDTGAIPLTRSNSRPPSIDSVYLSSPMFIPDAQQTSYFGIRTHSTPQLVTPTAFAHQMPDDFESSGSEGFPTGLPLKRTSKLAESPLQSFASDLTTDLRSHVTSGSASPSGDRKVVGTPDYLAPETILGISKDDRMVDWWALGVITYEFLYGFPPFHSESPDKVFENILSARVDWHEDYVDFSSEARDFIARLLEVDPGRRLGSEGPDEVKAHPFFQGIDWNNVTTQEAQFIPQVTDPESTDYFDPRGALPQLFQDEDVPISEEQTDGSKRAALSPAVQIINREHHAHSPSNTSDDFGSFSFKNLGVLKQANDDVIRKMKTEQLPALTQTLTESNANRRRSLSQRIRKPVSVFTGAGNHQSANPPTNPPSPSTSASSVASSPSYSSMGPSTPGSFPGHGRRISEYAPLERIKVGYSEGERRGGMPSRLRTASISSVDPSSTSDHLSSPLTRHLPITGSSESSSGSVGRRRSSASSTQDKSVTVLVAEDNPISAKILETLLTRMGCRCIVVYDGSEAVSVANGDIRFDVIMLDLNMPIINGEAAAQYIKNTKSKNTNTPIVCVSAYTGLDSPAPPHLFVASLPKPVQKADLLQAMKNLGFKTTPLSLDKQQKKQQHQLQLQCIPLAISDLTTAK